MVKPRADKLIGESLQETMTLTHSTTSTTTNDKRYQDLGVDATLTLTVLDSDIGVIVSKHALSVKEGQSADYTVRLFAEPSGDVAGCLKP